MKKLIALVLAVTLLASLPGVALAAKSENGMVNGNGAPSGSHYNLNIIGVPKDKTADMTSLTGIGHRIFVPLEGKTRILLAEAPEGESFAVLDANGTKGPAKFQLPNPDPDGDGTTVYSVYARALGKPGGDSKTTTGGVVDPGEDGILGTEDDVEIHSVVSLEITRTKGKSRFENVSKELLYIYADIDGDGVLDRVPLFDESLLGYFWDYDNNGLKVLQLRFYEEATTVPLPEELP